MTLFKSGDQVVLKSGGPTMTVDTVNTDIFDDNKMTGLLCVWFVGDKLERVRFDHGAVELACSQIAAPSKDEKFSEETTGEYKAVLDEMVTAMNLPSEDSGATSEAVRKQPKSEAAPKRMRSSRRAVRDYGEPVSGLTAD